MKSTDLNQMCDHLTIHPNLLINELKQRLKNLIRDPCHRTESNW